MPSTQYISVYISEHSFIHKYTYVVYKSPLMCLSCRVVDDIGDSDRQLQRHRHE